MTCNCRHWTACANSSGGCCSLGKFGGMPSFGTCSGCADYEGPKERFMPSIATAPTVADSIVHGAVGIAKAVAGMGGADAELVKSRTEICGACEHAILAAGLLQQCKLCGCSTWAKVRNRGEKCPAGKW